MKGNHYSLLIFFFFALALSSISCKKSEIPQINTLPVSGITQTTAQTGGEITGNGGEVIISRGVVWSASSEPTLEHHDGMTMDGSGDGLFNSTMTGLVPGTAYFARAFATNEVGTAYGNTILFNTNIDSTMLPIVTTDSVTYILHNSSIVYGNIVSEGGTSITVQGICWNTTGNPDITDLRSTTSGNQGSFSHVLSGLTPATTYYARAYATNSIGTAYGADVQFTTLGPLTGIPCADMPILTDFNGNIYNTVQIGTQCWMRENLRVRNFNDGIDIQNITSDTVWYKLYLSPAPARCWYQNDSAANAELYGSLYNWYAVVTGKLCPTDWHVPSKAEWEVMQNYLGGQSIAGGSMKATTHWNSPNTGATNVSGFTALPGGRRSPFGGGAFHGFGEFTSWWSSTIDIPVGAGEAWFHSVAYQTSLFYTNSIILTAGYSVRCIKSE